MAKPIFIVRMPLNPEREKGEPTTVFDSIKEEYHVLLVWQPDIDEPKFEMYSDKEIDPIELEKLKEIVNQL